MPSRPLENATQDWTPVVLNKSAQQARSMNTELQKNMSKQSSADANEKKLDKATEAGKIDLLSRDISVQLVAGRVAKKMSQKDFWSVQNILC